MKKFKVGVFVEEKLRKRGLFPAELSKTYSAYTRIYSPQWAGYLGTFEVESTSGDRAKKKAIAMIRDGKMDQLKKVACPFPIITEVK